MRRQATVICFGLFALLRAAPAEAVELWSHTSTQGGAFSEIRVFTKAQVFTRLRGIRSDGGEWNADASLTRARFKLDVRLGSWLRVNLEPEFRSFISPDAEPASSDLDLADIFLQIRPIKPLYFRVGQEKVPFGSFERISRWDLPIIRRGITTDLLDRLGYVGRRFGASAVLRLKRIPLRPELAIGAYGDLSGRPNEDAAADLSLRVFKGARVHLSGMTSRVAGGSDGRGWAGELSLEYERKRWFGLLDGVVGTGVGLSPNPALVDEMSTFFAVRVMLAYSFAVTQDLDLRPYLSAELFDPNASTTDDLGVAIRGGANLIWLEALRVGVELDRQAKEVGFVLPQSTRITLFLGVSLG